MNLLSFRPFRSFSSGRGGTSRRGLSPLCGLLVLGTTFSFACNSSVHAAVDVPVAEVDLPAPADGGSATAVLAGGCFWCTEAAFEQLKGVSDVVSGYAGGAVDRADYEQVSSGRTKHAESIRITYDPEVISYATLLRVFFGAAHDPTQTDGQGHDLGPQYRSAIFYASPEQKDVARAYIEQLDKAKVFAKPIATTLEPLPGFFLAEDYHQDYVRLHPTAPYVRGVSLVKVANVREGFPELLESQDPE